MKRRIQIHRAMVIAMILVMGSALFWGCAKSRIPVVGRGKAPEQIYTEPKTNNYQDKQVGVFRFSAAPYPDSVGYAASQSVFQALLAKKVFLHLIPAYDDPHLELDKQLSAAHDRGMDLVITGKVTYYLDGSRSQASRVDEVVMAYDVKSREMIWYAKASAQSKPSLEKDYVFIQKTGKPAQSASELIVENAKKISNLFR
ncbi:MAG: hypothetical protein JRH15_22615 [Deltaproteobacteria bacterium]|nr:hypothetical protein [Deltaproteobacteria bacterium]